MHDWNDIAVLAPTGDIDITTVGDLRRQVDDMMRAGIRRILVNCERVGFIDSTGVAFLLACARQLMHEDGLLSLENASPEIARFLQIRCLLEVLHVTSIHTRQIRIPESKTEPLWSKRIALEQGIENLAFHRHQVIDLLSALPMGHDARLDTVSAVGEALSNAYDHASCDGAMMTVHAFVDRVVIEVADCGEGFEIAPDEEPDESEERGRGIRLMRMLVNSVEVLRRTDGHGTIVRLVKLLSMVET